jgi:GAF domain-containing protein
VEESTTDRAAREKTVIALVKNSLHLPIANLLDILAAALQNLPRYTGVYIYLLDGDTLVLGPYRGRPTAHTRIQVGTGICGRAARVKATVTVDDVNADPEYIACSLETRSEIVVPIMRGERVLGEIDVYSDARAAFTDDDKRFLEEVARLITPQFP